MINRIAQRLAMMRSAAYTANGLRETKNTLTENMIKATAIKAFNTVTGSQGYMDTLRAAFVTLYKQDFANRKVGPLTSKWLPYEAPWVEAAEEFLRSSTLAPAAIMDKCINALKNKSKRTINLPAETFQMQYPQAYRSYCRRWLNSTTNQPYDEATIKQNLINLHPTSEDEFGNITYKYSQAELRQDLTKALEQAKLWKSLNSYVWGYISNKLGKEILLTLFNNKLSKGWHSAEYEEDSSTTIPVAQRDFSRYDNLRKQQMVTIQNFNKVVEPFMPILKQYVNDNFKYIPADPQTNEFKCTEAEVRQMKNYRYVNNPALLVDLLEHFNANQFKQLVDSLKTQKLYANVDNEPEDVNAVAANTHSRLFKVLREAFKPKLTIIAKEAEKWLREFNKDVAIVRKRKIENGELAEDASFKPFETSDLNTSKRSQRDLEFENQRDKSEADRDKADFKDYNLEQSEINKSFTNSFYTTPRIKAEDEENNEWNI